MSDLRQAAAAALEALEAMQSYAAAERKGLRICDEAITALRQALAEPEQPEDARAVVRRVDCELKAEGHATYTEVWKSRAALLVATRHFLAVSTGHLPDWLLQPAQAMRQATEDVMGETK